MTSPASTLDQLCPSCKAPLRPAMRKCRECGFVLEAAQRPASSGELSATGNAGSSDPAAVAKVDASPMTRHPTPATAPTDAGMTDTVSAGAPGGKETTPQQGGKDTGTHISGRTTTEAPLPGKAGAATSNPKAGNSTPADSAAVQAAASVSGSGSTPALGSAGASGTRSADDRVTVLCGDCGATMKVRIKYMGKKIPCVKCTKPVMVMDAPPEVLKARSISGSTTTASGRFVTPTASGRFTYAAAAARRMADFVLELEGLEPAVEQKIEYKKVLGTFKFGRVSGAIKPKNATGTEHAQKRKVAMVELGKSRDVRAFDLLAIYAEDNWVAVRDGLAEALGELGDPRGVPILVRLLDDDSPDVRRTALTALGKVGDGRATRALLQFSLQEPMLRFASTEAITRIGVAAAPFLMKTLGSDDPGIILESVLALGRLKAKLAVDQISLLLEHRIGLLRAHAAEALGMIGDPAAIGALTRALGDADPSVRANAVVSLGRLDDKRTCKALRQALQDADADVCERAATALGLLEDAESVPQLTKLLLRPEARIRAAATETLGRIADPESAPQLIQLLRDKDEQVRLRAVSAFRKFRSPDAVSALLPLLHDANPFIRQRAVDALGEISEPETVEPLISCLRTDASVEVRVTAAKALGQLALPSAIPALEKALEDDFPVRCRAIVALGEIGDQSSLPVMLAMLRDPMSEVRYHATQALAELGHPNSLAPLEMLLTDPDAMVRRGAAKSLIKMGDPRGDALLVEAQKQPAPKTGFNMSTMGGMTPNVLLGLLWPASNKQKGIVFGGLTAVIALGVIGYQYGGAMLKFAPSVERVSNRGVVQSCALSGDGTMAVLGYRRGDFEFWKTDSESRSEVVPIAELGDISGTVLGPDGKTGLFLSGVKVFGFKEGKAEELPPHAKEIRRVISSPDQKAAISMDGDNICHLWDLTKPAFVKALAFEFKGTASLGMNNAGTRLAHGVAKSIAVWDLEKAALAFEHRVSQTATSAAFSQDDLWLAVDNAGLEMHFISMKNPRQAKIRPAPARAEIPWMGFHPIEHQKLLVIRGQKIERWDANTGDVEQVCDLPNEPKKPSVSADHKFLTYLLDESKFGELFNLETKQLVRTIGTK